MAKKLVSLLLALLMITALALGCAEPADDTSTDTTTAAPAPDAPSNSDAETTPADTAAAETTPDPYYISDVPGDLNFGGRKINLLVAGEAFSKDEFDAVSQNGSVVNDAVYMRNLAVEEALGVDLVITVSGADSVYNVGNAIRNAVATGDRSYDIATMPGYTNTSYVLEGDFLNLLDIDGLDLDKGYWTQGFNEIISNGTKQYIASGAYSLSMYRNMYITLYNKDLFAANGLEDLFDIVNRGEWTLERQSQMASGLYNDLNGDSTRDSGDLYGFVSGANTSVDPYWVSMNIPMLTLNDGIYEVNYDTEKVVSAVTAVQNMLFDNEGSFCVGTSGGDVDGSNATTIISQFSENKAAMCTTTIYKIESYLTPRNFESSYGIAPIPKYDENQSEYYTHVQDQLSVIGVVSTVSGDDVAMMGAVLDKIAEQSYKHVYPAYYKSALSYKYLQDAQSVEMLDLIYHSIKIEGAFIYSAKFAMLGKLRTIVSANASNRISSLLRSYNKTWQLGADDLNEGLAKLEH